MYLMNWDQYWIEMAKTASLKSKDRSTKVGAVIVNADNDLISTGFNAFCRGLDDDIESRHERPAKYDFTAHAEENSILNCARTGVSCKRCILYLNFAPTCCITCSRAIIQSGIKCVVGDDIYFTGKGNWDESMRKGAELMWEAGIDLYVVRKYSGDRVPLIDWLKEQGYA
jgi:dCMP deaminase